MKKLASLLTINGLVPTYGFDKLKIKDAIKRFKAKLWFVSL